MRHAKKKQLHANNARRDTSKTGTSYGYRPHKHTSKAISTKELQRLLNNKKRSEQSQSHNHQYRCLPNDNTTFSTHYDCKYGDINFRLSVGDKSSFWENMAVIPYGATQKNTVHKRLTAFGRKLRDGEICNTTKANSANNVTYPTYIPASSFWDQSDSAWQVLGKIQMSPCDPVIAAFYNCLLENLPRMQSTDHKYMLRTSSALGLGSLAAGVFSASVICPLLTMVFCYKMAFFLAGKFRRASNTTRTLTASQNEAARQKTILAGIQNGKKTIDELKDFIEKKRLDPLKTVEILDAIDPNDAIVVPDEFTCQYITHEIMEDPVQTRKDANPALAKFSIDELKTLQAFPEKTWIKPQEELDKICFAKVQALEDTTSDYQQALFTSSEIQVK